MTRRKLNFCRREAFWKRGANFSVVAFFFATFLGSLAAGEISGERDRSAASNGGDTRMISNETLGDSSSESTAESIRVGFARLGSETTADVSQNRPKTSILLRGNSVANDVFESGESNGRFVGKRTATVPKSSETSFFSALVSAVGALSLVLGVFLGAVFLLKLFAPGKLSGTPGATELVESRPIAGKAELLTIRWGRRLVLAARTSEKIAPLAETFDPAEIGEILDAAARRQKNASGDFVGWTDIFGILKSLRAKKTLKFWGVALLGANAVFGGMGARNAAFAQGDAFLGVPSSVASEENVDGVGKGAKAEKTEKKGGRQSGDLLEDSDFVDLKDVQKSESFEESEKNERLGENKDAAQNRGSFGSDVLLGPDGWLGPSGISTSLKTMLTLSILTLAPAILLMTTSFVRLSIVLALLRQALGAGQVPSNQTTTALAIFLTLLIMAPVWTEVYNDAVGPYSSGEISADAAFERGQAPIRSFLARQIERTGNVDAVWLFMRYVPDVETPKYFEDVPWRALAPAFLLSELKTAFLIGFQIFVPFLIIDVVVSCVLVSVGMPMLPPTIVALPLKLALFVLIDGWTLVVKSLLESFAWSVGG